MTAQGNGRLQLDPQNARKHSPRNKALIRQSLDVAGAGRSILADADGIIRAGNGVYELWGDRPVKVVESDGKELVVVKRTDLSGKAAVRAAMLDNLAADSSYADYDADILAAIVKDDELIATLAREDKAIAALLAKAEPQAEKVDAGELIDKAAELQKKWQVVRGNVWECGKHRLMCGDSTSEDDVTRLMGEEKAGMVSTDPPYGVAYQDDMDAREAVIRHRRRDGQVIENDARGIDGTKEFLTSAFGRLPINKGGSFYICAPAGDRYIAFLLALSDSGLQLRQQLCWVKQQMVFGRQDYHYQHELLIYGWKDGAPHYFCDDRTQTSVWAIDRPMVSKEHPTMKPIALAAKAISNSSKHGDTVFDGFLGSGTTLVACEQTGRIGYGMEIEPKYCAVSLERLANLGLSVRRNAAPVQ